MINTDTKTFGSASKKIYLFLGENIKVGYLGW